LLVKVLRIIENEDITNASLIQKFQAKEQEESKLSQIENINRETDVDRSSAIRERLKQYFNQKIISKIKNKDSDETMKTKMFALLKMSAKRRAIDFYSA
jgi:DNA-binding protein H-NS